MPGDYTRLTFDPLRDRAMVLEQQGRVHLDADFNELVAILERRLRVETRDFAGAAVIPATLPESFQIKLSGTEITIAPGRMYVDGLLAENHGSGSTVYDPVWGEPGYEGPTKLSEQPYGTPDLVPAIEQALLEAGVLVYLDVWQRERTAAEEASIVESALGVDTCTRVQTVWQVRLLALEQAGMTCASEWSTYAPWQATTRPSMGRLSSKAVGVAQPSDPCAVAPVGGYRGLENRLYRVEVHDGGGAGTATFKWSRDNAAVASPITAIEAPAAKPVITVERLGRDEVLRFNANDWVELLDDTHELDGRPGVMGQVLENDPTANTVTLTQKLAGSIDLTKNPRLRRWDQQNGVNANGVIEVPTSPTALELEDGVEVTLELAPTDPGEPAGEFKSGDWWVFAARAATASIEELDKQPPRGIRHHYARLAVIEGATVSSCRVPFPGECECDGDGCECTACVTPQTHADGQGPFTLQDAINKVTPMGGRVCVAPGRYQIDEPLSIRQARSLTLVGAGSATLITYSGEGGCGILVEDSVEVSLERFALAVAAESSGAPAKGTADAPIDGMVGIALANTIDCLVERCFVLVGLVPGTGQDASFGLGDLGIGLAGIALRTRLRENVVFASTAIGDMTTARSDLLDLETAGGGTPSVNPGAFRTTGLAVSYEPVKAVAGYLLSADLAIEDNLLLALRVGIDLGSAMSAASNQIPLERSVTLMLAATRIADNLILGSAIAGIVLFGLGGRELPPTEPPAGSPGERVRTQTPSPDCEEEAGARATMNGLAAGSATLVNGGLDVAGGVGADEVTVAGNVLMTTGDGIRATTDGLTVRDNQIAGAAAASSRMTTGVLLGADRGSADGRATVAGNSIRDFGLGGVIAAGQLGSLTVTGNRIAAIRSYGRRSFGIATLGIGNATQVSVSANTLSEIGPRSPADGFVVAIYLARTRVARVSGNDLSEIATVGWTGGLCIGVMVLGCETAEVSGNVLSEVGPEAAYTGRVIGIGALGFATLDVRGNTVEVGEGEGESFSVPLYIEGLEDPWIDRQAVMSGASGYVELEGRAFGEEEGAMPLGFPDLGVHGNTLYGAGRESAVRIVAPVNVLLADNRARRESAQESVRPVVYVETRCATIVSANRVEDGYRGEDAVLDIHVLPEQAKRPPCTVLGNIANGPIHLNDQPLGVPWAPLNIQT